MQLSEAVKGLWRRSAPSGGLASSAEVKQEVRRRYEALAGAGGGQEACCAAMAESSGSSFALEHGLYSEAELSLLPDIARDLSRGCDNSTGFADLQPGEVVVDFGCGGGIDVILAAHKVRPHGRVIGVDMAPEMIERGREAVAAAALDGDVELRVAEMADTQLSDGSADVAISNCVINLAPDQDAVYREIFRILRPEGRLAISDIVLAEDIDPVARERYRATWAGCLGGAEVEQEYLKTIERAGFSDIEVVDRHVLPPRELQAMAGCPGPEFSRAPTAEELAPAEGKVASIKVTARR